MNLQGFLRKAPQPVAMRVTTDAGEKIVKVNLKDSRPWGRASATIGAMRGTMVECLDAKGHVLRAIPIEREPEAEEEEETKGKGSRITELSQLATLLNAAHDNGAKRHADAYEKAFTMLANLVSKLTDVQVKNIALVNRLLQRVAALSEAGDAPADGEGNFMERLIMQHVMPGAPGHANGAANGAGGGLPPDVVEFLRKRAAEGKAPAEGEEPEPEGED
jgi:hypothetical protein